MRLLRSDSYDKELIKTAWRAQSKLVFIFVWLTSLVREPPKNQEYICPPEYKGRSIKRVSKSDVAVMVKVVHSIKSCLF